MPRLIQPLSMKKWALQSLAEHFEVVCYGTSRLGALIEDGSYLDIQGPFVQWRKSFILFLYLFLFLFDDLVLL